MLLTNNKIMYIDKKNMIKYHIKIIEFCISLLLIFILPDDGM